MCENTCSGFFFIDMSKRITTEEFIEKAKKKHGDKYDYSNVNYINNHTPVCIICRKHGEFFVRPIDFLRSKNGSCKECQKEKLRSDRQMGKEAFVRKSIAIHGMGFNYDDVIYVNNRTKVKIICPNGHKIEQAPDNHFKYGCYMCAGTYRPTTEEFIKKAQKVHGDRYDYSRVRYVRSHDDIEIVCKKHGAFMQTPTDHLDGKGCPLCRSSNMEEKVRGLLMENNIIFQEQAKFPWLKNDKTQKELSFDFYLPDKNIAIECQGIQHFKPLEFFGGEEAFKETRYRDEIKKELAEKHLIKILYFSTIKYDFPYEVITKLEEIIKNL